MRLVGLLILVALAASGCGGGGPTVGLNETFTSNHVDYSVTAVSGQQVSVRAQNTTDEPQSRWGSWTTINLHVDDKTYTPTGGSWLEFDPLQPGQSQSFTLTFSVAPNEDSWLEFVNENNDSPFDRVAKVNL